MYAAPECDSVMEGKWPSAGGSGGAPRHGRRVAGCWAPFAQLKAKGKDFVLLVWDSALGC